jgi:thioredoxin 1
VEVCTDDLPEIAEEAGVTSIPTIQLYHEGKLLDTIVGCVAKNVLGNAVNKVLEDLGLDPTVSENDELGNYTGGGGGDGGDGILDVTKN